eukprot:1221943-Rhodomonas_salina.2
MKKSSVEIVFRAQRVTSWTSFRAHLSCLSAVLPAAFGFVLVCCAVACAHFWCAAFTPHVSQRRPHAMHIMHFAGLNTLSGTRSILQIGSPV